MFSNLENIAVVYIKNLIGGNSTFYYTFSNCINLKKFTLDIKYDNKYAIKDMSGMFFNCPSLTSFSFENFYLNYYGQWCCYIYDYYDYEYYNYYSYEYCNFYYDCEDDYYDGSYDYQLDDHYELYNKINMSYMFYNCTDLKSITMNGQVYGNISNMEYMFYNCFSLESINLEKITTGNLNINLSYTFYNCYSLKTITFNSKEKSFGVKDMKYMFYNCSELNTIVFVLLE